MTHREIDVAIEKRVFGRNVVKLNEKQLRDLYDEALKGIPLKEGGAVAYLFGSTIVYGSDEPIPRYSSDIAAAMILVDKMDKLGYFFRLSTVPVPPEDGFYCAEFIEKDYLADSTRPGHKGYAFSDFPAHAISLAIINVFGLDGTHDK